MNLHEAIDTVLKENNRPMSAKDIASAINIKDYYEKTDNTVNQAAQIQLSVKKYPYLFENVNGLIFLSENRHWKNIINGYLYLKETLRGHYNTSNIRFIIAALLFYKRIVDTNKLEVEGYSKESDYEKQIYFIEKFIKEGNWFELLSIIENLEIAPKKVFKEVADLLRKLDSNKNEAIISILKEIDTKSFNDREYGNIYEYLLYQHTNENSGYEYSTPETIRFLLPELLDIKNSSQITVYDPIAGIGGLLTKLLDHNDIILKGSEINTGIAQLGNMNLRMYGYKNNEAIRAENCFEEINNKQKYDYIVGDLPINGITNFIEHHIMYSQFGLKAPKSGKGFSSLVLFSYYKLSEKGKAVITVSDSFLSKGGKEKEIRHILLTDDVVEAVISLPKGIYRPYTEAKPSILIVNKDKPEYLRNKVKFIKVDAIEETKKSLLLDTEEIINEYLSDFPNNKSTQIIDLNDIDTDLNLSAEVYNVHFSEANRMLKEGKAKYLKDLVYIQSGVQPIKEKIREQAELPIVKIENLSKEVLDINLNLDDITSKTEYDDTYKRAIVDQKSIIIAKIGESLKPTIFLPTSNYSQILLHVNTLSLIPKGERLLDMDYLYYQLNSPSVEEQIESISKRKNALIAFFNKKDIENIIIPYEDLETQKKFVSFQKVNLIAAESQKLEERKKIIGYEEKTKEAEINVVRTITHQLKHSLSGIDALIQKIGAIVHKNNIGALKEYKDYDPILIKEEGFETPENGSLQHTVDKALKKSSLLNQILTDVKKAIHLELKYEVENIYVFLNKLKDERHDIAIEIKGDKNIELDLSKSHIEDLFNTLINNAVQHSGLSKEKLQITFLIKKDKNTVKIEYRNNGKPIGISEEEFKSIATKSHMSTGTGVGGYYINKIIEAHSGILTIEDTTTSGVFMIIELPFKNEDNG